MNSTTRRARSAMPIFLILLLGGAVLSAFWQQRTIADLRTQNQALRLQSAEMERLRQENARAQEHLDLAQEVEKLRKDNAELNRLRNEVRQLRTHAPELEQLRAENQRLQTANQQLLRQKQTAETQAASTSANQAAAMATAKARAESVQCVNQLKQIGLAGRLWAADNNGNLPPDLPSLNHELPDPRILVCPSDADKAPAANWAEIQPGHISYAVMSPGVPSTDAAKVFVQCPIHKHACLVDGSVRAGESGR